MKRISLFMMAVATAFAAGAQSEPQLRTKMEVKPRFGIKAGVNLANLEIDDDASAAAGTNTTRKTSVNGGFFYNIPVSESFRVQPELLYSIQGAKSNAMTSTDPNLAGLTEYDFHYLAVPVMLQYATPGGFMVELGPQFSYLSSANGDKANAEVDLKKGDYIKSIDFAAGGGVGYLSRIGLGINARYMHGFTNVFNNDDRPATTSGMTFRNRNFQIGLSYHFGAGK